MIRKPTTAVIAMAIAFALLLPATGSADVDFVLELDPLGFLISPDVDDFRVSRGFSYEEISGVGSLVPTLKLGVGFESDTVILDLMAGAGYLWNDAFNSATFSGEAFLRFKVDQKGIFTLGPHLGVVRFSPSWEGGASDLEMDDTTGWVAGLGLTVGSPKVAFAATFDYLSAKFDVAGKNGWVPSDNELDVSGVQILLGVQFRF